MCGIFGYTGKRDAQPLVIEGLKQLEYRGYDSAGIAVQNGLERIAFEKTRGKIKSLEELLRSHPLKGSTAIGHTRWATHGMPNRDNAHPHLDNAGHLAVVHNGIIENYFELKKKLEFEGIRFASETDTEVIVHLVSKYYKGRLEEAVRRALKDLKGSYAIAVISSQEPGKIVAAKMDSPLVIGSGEHEQYLASDLSALIEHTHRITFVENGEMVCLEKEAFKIFDKDGKPVHRKPEIIEWDLLRAKKGGYAHFMLKEIFEQPDILAAILQERVEPAGCIHFDELKIRDTVLRKVKRVAVIACGTAYHAGLVAKYVFERWTDLPVWVDTSSEFRYRDPRVGPDTLVIVISQSGETADTLAGLREARRKGALTLAVCNVLGSSIARQAHGVVYTHAGPEIAVASTKAYTAQMAVLYLLALYLGGLRRALTPGKTRTLLKEFFRLPALMRHVLDGYQKEEKTWSDRAHDFNDRYHKELENYFRKDPGHHGRAPNACFLYLARHINYPNALEGALKLKEISYISAEGYPAGEMKHGPIALIDENPWVICIAPRSATYEKMISNMQEIKARKGILIPVVTEGDEEILKIDPLFVITVPDVDEMFSPFLTVIPLQLWAYCVAREFKEDIDQPRNLAKSVTVE